VQAAREAQRVLHRQPILDRRILEFEMAEDVIGLQRKLSLRTDEMEMRIAPPRRQFQFRLGIRGIDLWRKRAFSGRVIHACTLKLGGLLRATDARASSVQLLKVPIDAPLAERN